MELQEQVKAYTAWVNSQLKKRSQYITDLSQDLSDGFALATVVEIVAGQNLDAVEPTTNKEKKENVLKVLKFMKESGIKLHHVSAEEIISGNVKTIMQLILALAAHFKPASIGGRKHNHVEKSHKNQSDSNNAWRTPAKETFEHQLNEAEHKLRIELESDLSNVRVLAENLQKLLVEELDNQPIDEPHPFEDSVLLQAKLDQSSSENQRLKNELEKLHCEIRGLRNEKTVVDSRLQQHEHEILTLRQDLLKKSVEKDRLVSEKEELILELEETEVERDNFRKHMNKKEARVHELEDEIHFLKAEQAILMTRKDKEIFALQKQTTSFNSEPSVQGATVRRMPHSPVLPHSPTSPSYHKLNGSPKLSRRSPVSKTGARKGRLNHKLPEDPHTRVLYFDHEMKPAMTTISKSVGDITLEDFKEATKTNGNYRFIFKALDPELGTVKEEIFRNDDVVPGWEGKIVAWVEEEVRV